jgi:coenzyme F420-reducing hydrogenase delta subunit/NAD-dependent dihydropyrimidine dehydrogenase PreA subunit
MSRALRPAPPPADAGPAGPPRVAALVARPLALADALFARAFGSRWNPIHQTGNLAVVFLLATLATGLILFLFYEIDDPHGSVERLRTEVFLGGWLRSIHRYAADLAVLATALHLLRKLVQGHTWGPRTLAWTSGVLLLGLLLFCGWTGLILVWDAQALGIALEGARLADLAPIFATPIARAFTGAATVPSSFFFMNLFLHVALPLGLAAMLAVHVARVARPALLPPRRLAALALGLLALVAAVLPVPLGAEADLLALPGRAPLDPLFSFWLPLARGTGPWGQLGFWTAAALLAFLAPRFWRPRAAGRPQPINTSWVDERCCTGCTHCVSDCPYEAIAMVPRAEGRGSELVARVDPARCVGCGICAGSCAPMGVGPYGRTGRDQLGALDALFPPAGLVPEVVVFACRSAGWDRATSLRRGDTGTVEIVPLSCAGSLHTAAIESSLRRGVGGVLVLSCPPRDCRFREGPKWTEQRLFHGREAELHERVDRTRVAFAALSTAEVMKAAALVDALRRRARELALRPAEGGEVEAVCESTADPDLVELAARG